MNPDKADAAADAAAEKLSSDDKLHPGFLIRRFQQVSVMLFLEQLGQHNVTPIQFTLLRLVDATPDIDQVTIAKRAALDPSTVADVISRMEQKGLIERVPAEADRRKRIVRLTWHLIALPDGAEGKDVLEVARPLAAKARQILFAPLDAEQQKTLLDLISIVVDHQSADILGGGRASKPWSRVR